MIDAFGGMSSEHYQDFRKECYTAFVREMVPLEMTLTLGP